MSKPLLFILLAIYCMCSCKKENDAYVKGEVIQQGGCFQDDYLVAIENPDFSQHSFLRASIQSCMACYNCSNSAYIRLDDALATPGTRIRFKYSKTDPSCLSYSEAPPHISVTNISKL